MSEKNQIKEAIDIYIQSSIISFLRNIISSDTKYIKSEEIYQYI